MTTKIWIALFGLILVVLLAASLLMVAVSVVGRSTLSCDQLPTTARAEAIVADHAELVDQIEAVNQGFVFVNVVADADCSSRARLIIAYATERDRQAIEAILRRSPGHTGPGLFSPPRLFGIPYRLANT